ncbi:hypothetical protein B566_EDAN015499 [Ephemera danica]|nr:hypothetical protein B566_EDAN015499 [Ephemera danica]
MGFSNRGNRVSPSCMSSTTSFSDYKKIDDQQQQVRKNLQQTMSQRLSNSFRKFLLLIWKNTYVIRKRHWLATLFEIIVPLFLFLLMAVLRASTGAFGVVNHANATYYSEISESELLSYENEMLRPSVSSAISYAPTNDFTTKLVQRLATKCKLRDDAVEGFDSENSLIDHYNKLILKNPESEQEINAIIFEDDATNGRLPEKLKYKLRLNHYPHFPTESLFGSLQAPPYSDHDQGYTTVAQQLLPILAVISFLPLCIVVITRVVEEKQTGVRELMRLMGMESWAMWASWLVDALIVRIITLALVVTLVKVEFETDAGAVFNLTDGSLVYFMLLLYTIAGICSCFLLSTFFSKPSVAMSVGLIFWLSSYTLPSMLINKYVPGFNIRRALMLFPNTALYFMLIIILDFEVKDVGAQWWNFLESSTGAANDVSMADVALMLTISTILCSLLTWYIGCIAPGEFGVARPWYFLFTATYWKWDTDEDQGMNFERPLSKDFNEPVVGVFIRDLSKTYEGGLGKLPIKAVRGLSLDLYKGEVTALLGHNGAGKTTTMSILTGMIAPSGGAVTVLGHNLATELSTVRNSLGLCPQHNMLFKDLTVREHLIFFAMMKGNSYEAAITEAQELVEQVKLKEKWNEIATHLSGGMKRKLALAVALIGGSKVLMLDEPTSGLDPEARREIWDLLLGMRGQRTILLSTHFMEEADVLGDTIAIMAHGKVHCCGSSIYLKRHYGAGYHLTVLRKPKCDVDSISQLVSKAVPDAEFLRSRNEDQTDSGGPSAAISPITFRLPSNSTHLFAKMLDKLESSCDELGIANVSMSVTTMEEVFLKVGQLTDIAKAKEEKAEEMDETDCAPINGDNCYVDQERNDSSEALTMKNIGWRLLLQQLWALMVKKFLHIAVSLAIVIATVTLSSSVGGSVDKNYPPLPLSLSAYGDSKDLTVLYSATPGSEAAKASDAYMMLANKLATVKKVSPSKGVLHGLLEESINNELAYKTKYIVAASFNETSDASLMATAFFSSTALHANPISLNLLMNSILAWKTGSSKYHIEAINHPFREQLNGHSEAPLVVAMIWLLIPPVAWLTVTASTIMLPLQERVCENLCKLLKNCFKPIPYLAWEGDTSSLESVVKYGPFLREIVFLLLGCCWIVVVIMLDSSLVALAKEKVLSLMQRRHSEDVTDSVPMDDDVQEECSRVTQTCNTSSQTEAILTVQNFVKDYGIPIRHSRFHAVRGITFAVKPGECFGLLGVNGAGKTTTFQMLTGGEVPTQGDATLLGRRLSTNRFRYLQDLGYCPQFDAQLDVLTGYETLRLYANLRGMPSHKINSEINRCGGNRRKLSAAMALIGEPPLVLLDEPTSGVDPIARRRLWHVLERCQRSGQAIVLTSHSMDECEALCDRLGIMVSGQLRCLGPTAHLKQKFGQGFTVMVKVRTASWTATPEHLKATSQALQKLEEQIKDRLHPCTLRDQHQGLLHYHVTDPKKRWSELFAAMEELKLQHAEILEDYTISETTLEQVFLSFARNKAMLEDSDEVNPV